MGSVSLTKPAQPEVSNAVAATAMFVEVLVVGIGSLAALVIFLAAIAGPKNTEHLAPLAGSTVVAGLALAFAYALGILVDRGADAFLASTRRRLRGRHFPSNVEYNKARRFIASYPDLVARADYARSRMRICRGWVLNSFFLFVVADFAIIRFTVEHRALLIAVTTVLGGLLTLGFYVAWRNITSTSYKKLAQQAQPDVLDVPAQQGTAVNHGAPDASMA